MLAMGSIVLKRYLPSGTLKEGKTYMFSDAISLKFRGQKFRTSSNSVDHFVEFWEHPPNGQDIAALMALGVLEVLELKDEIPTFGPQDKNSV
jgi:hypothetical protein